MMIREDKKILSSSFSAETVPLTGKKIVSMSVEKPVMNLQHGEDMTREQNVITKIIDKLKDVSGAVWLLNSF